MNTNIFDLDDTSLFLSGIEVFSELDEEVIYDIAKKLESQFYVKGQYLITKGEVGDQLFIIKEGRVLVELGKDSVTLNRGTIVGEISLISGEARLADVLVTSDATEVYSLSCVSFNELMGRHKSLATAMTELMQSRIEQSSKLGVIGKYKVLNKLGEGAMATVYCAYDTVLDRNVAIKMLNFEVATRPEFKQRFKREALIIAKLNHPNIMQIIEVIEAYSTNFIVMEKVEGHDLNYYLKKHGAFSVEQTRSIISQVALALEHAHQQDGSGIVHRDVKPSNIILEKNGNVKLMDFGIAGSPKELIDNMGGTANYMAPEIIQGHSFDGLVDIYALGITAFVLLTGEPPFKSSELTELLCQQVNEPIPDIRKLRKDIPANLVEFIHRAMEKDPSRRISSWEKIHSLVKPQFSRPIDTRRLEKNEAEIVVRVRDMPERHRQQLIEKISETLEQNKVNFEIDTLLPERHKKSFFPFT
jgi:serine/threonine protein kinase